MARLPVPGSDKGQWGAILNEFLLAAHNSDGTLKDTGVLASKYVKPVSGIPKSDLAADVQGALDTIGNGGVPDASTTIKGIVRLAGDLSGDAMNPTIGAGRVTGGSGGHIASGTITDTNINASAAIAQSKIQNLTSDLAGKAATSHTHSIANVTGLQTALDEKATTAHTHTIANVTNLQTTLDGKAATVHTHTAGSITDFTDATAAVIGDRVQAGTNVTVDFDSGTGITTISSSGGGGGGEPSETVLSVAGKTGDVVLAAGDIASGTFTTSRIPDLNASKITSGTLDVARIPTGTTGSTVALGNHTHSDYAATSHTHSASNITSGTLDISRIPTGTTDTTVALGDHTHIGYAASSHTHSIANVTGLQTAIDGKAATSHSHAISDVTNLSTSLSSKLDTTTLSTTWGVLPRIHWTGTSWPSRTLPSGYSGAVIWDSATDASATPPSASLEGDRWIRRIS